ncbi:abortive infection family protein [Rhodopirellula sallentina]|uniref:Uncharacterized protein n=1 Tax=Rhodopirellula sallentina SM41 TaxID=1263870 RepID=M5UB63_9BACT|nr:abortive infection family protein [Rhodopirellula sallentina]EMI55091.1 hypothetical protein RSSM_03415 [Rhodopirellula sallentina SM41]
MDTVKEIIEHQIGRFPEFAYYLPLIEKAKADLVEHPDICIETCKSLLEGISKSIIEKLPNPHARPDLDKLEVGPLVKLAVTQLKVNNDIVEDDFLKRCSSLAYAMGALRNARGDISHGKGAPKLHQSDDKLSSLSLKMTASVLFYMLDAFFSIPDPEVAPVGEERIEYEDNPDFNQSLDDENPLDGRVLYSRALYDQYYEDYTIQLSDYQYEQELQGELEE